MKVMIIPALLAVLMIFAACDTKVQTSQGSADTVKTYRIDEIAGDKTMMASAMRASYMKGTFDDALALAMQDSAFAQAVAAAVRTDPRLSRKPLAESAAAHSATPLHRYSGQAVRQGDVLDKAEETARKANERLDQAGRVKKQAEEAKRKVDEILKP